MLTIRPDECVNVCYYDHMKRQNIVIGSLAIALGISVISLVVLLNQNHSVRSNNETNQTQVLAAATYESLSFPVYFPTPLPSGVSLRPGSVSSTGAVYTYVLDTAPRSFVYVSIQPVAYEVVTSFRADQEFQTYLGRAYIVSRDSGKTSAAIVTDKTMILMNAPGGVAESQLRHIIDAMRPVE